MMLYDYYIWEFMLNSQTRLSNLDIPTLNELRLNSQLSVYDLNKEVNHYSRSERFCMYSQVSVSNLNKEVNNKHALRILIHSGAL